MKMASALWRTEFIKLDNNLSRKFISLFKSSIFFSLFFVPKKDDSLQPCVNYGKVNNSSVKNAFSLPLIKNIMQSISGPKYFTKLDLRNEYVSSHLC